MSKARYKQIAFWITTILGPISFVVGGFLFVTHGEQQVEVLNHLGYPTYFLSILGFWKLLGALIIAIPGLPRVKEWAYAGFFFELSGAAASHAFSGSSLAEIVQPLVFLALVIASWALRPPGRKLYAERQSGSTAAKVA